jgi:hypothetical protein
MMSELNLSLDKANMGIHSLLQISKQEDDDFDDVDDFLTKMEA